MTSDITMHNRVELPRGHAEHFRCTRVTGRIAAWIFDMHPQIFTRFSKLMALGLQPTNAKVFDLTDIGASDRVDGWHRLDAGNGHLAANVGWPIRFRDDGDVKGHIVAGQDRGGALWGLTVWLAEGEVETSPAFILRCAEALQVHGVEPVQVA